MGVSFHPFPHPKAGFERHIHSEDIEASETFHWSVHRVQAARQSDWIHLSVVKFLALWVENIADNFCSQRLGVEFNFALRKLFHQRKYF